MSPGLLFLAYGVIVIMAMYVFVYIPNKKKHRKMQEMHDSIAAGDMVITIGGVVGRVVKKEGGEGSDHEDCAVCSQSEDR